MLPIHVNGKETKVPQGTTIEQLLASVELPGNYLAVEVNQEVVSRDQHASRQLSAGDQIELVTLVGGG